MAIALSISFLRNYLPDPGPIGSWLRFNLTAELRHRYSATPAILLARSSPAFTALQHADARAEGLFGRLLHALVSVNLGISQDWKDLPAPALLTLPWLLLFPRLGLTDQRQVKYLRTRWITMGDMLWLKLPITADGPVPTALGLPPSRSATAANRSSSAAPALGGVPSLNWPALWHTLAPHHSAKLATHCLGTPSPYRLPGPFHVDTLRARTPSETLVTPRCQPATPPIPPSHGTF